MARPPRLEFPGAVYHVTARGNERRPVYRDDRDREEYLARIAEYRDRFQFQLLGYCLMTNHVHLAVRTGVVPLSRIMGGLHSTYTQWFNRRHRRVGHLFQGRYKAFLVQEDCYLVALIRYIHRNPVEAKLVERASGYRWSSDRFFRRGDAPSWFDLDGALPSFGPTPSSAIRRYVALVDGRSIRPSYEDLPAIEQMIKGDELFALNRFEERGQLEPPLRGLSEDRVIEVVARITGVAADDLTGPRQGGQVAFARCVAAYVAKRLGRIPVSRMARRFHLDDSSLARPLSALDARLAQDASLRAQIDRIVIEIREPEARRESNDEGRPERKSENQG